MTSLPIDVVCSWCGAEPATTEVYKSPTGVWCAQSRANRIAGAHARLARAGKR